MPHQVLEVDEILRVVAACVVDVHPPTAVSLACCAKCFEEPILSTLWKTQELPTLIKTLPPTSWKYQRAYPRESRVRITFTRIPSGDEWTRFLRYASWVRSLRSSDVLISDGVFRQLSSVTSGGPVCPQLRRLTWTFSYGWDHMQQFLSPHLISVTFLGEGETGHNIDQALAPTIALLPTTYLKEIEFKHLQSSAPIQSALSEVVQRLNTHFKRLATGFSLSDPAWAHLASLPNLESLRVSGTPSTEIQKSKPHESTFPVLKSVRIKVENTHQHWSSLFSLLESSPIRRVAIVKRPGIRIDDVPKRVTIALLEAGLQQSVYVLTFSEFDPTSLTFISRLGPFSSLKILRCDTQCQGLGRCAFPPTDSDIGNLASGLPRLVALRLGHGCGCSAYNTTIKSIISLSFHCLSLEELHLPCDLTNISEDAKTESGEPDSRLQIQSSCKLQFLAFPWVITPPSDDIKALRVVALALHHLFPQSRLGELWPGEVWLGDSWGRGAGELGVAWKATLDMMANFRR